MVHRDRRDRSFRVTPFATLHLREMGPETMNTLKKAFFLTENENEQCIRLFVCHEWRPRLLRWSLVAAFCVFILMLKLSPFVMLCLAIAVCGFAVSEQFEIQVQIDGDVVSIEGGPFFRDRHLEFVNKASNNVGIDRRTVFYTNPGKQIVWLPATLFILTNFTFPGVRIVAWVNSHLANNSRQEPVPSRRTKRRN